MTESFYLDDEEVTDFTAQLPATTLEAPCSYPRGTLLTLQVQVRVKSLRLDEDRKGGLSRKHMLAIEECTITDVMTPAERRAFLEAAAEETKQELARAERAAAGYVVPEEPEISATHPDGEPSDSDSDEDSFSEDEKQALYRQYLADGWSEYEAREEVWPANASGDEDDGHSWMDEDDDTGVHVDLGALVG